MAGTDLDRSTADTLDSSLVDEINRHHRDVERHARSMLDSAIECGRLLDAAKSRLPHGDWLPWLAENFDGSVRNAQVYMRLHEHRDEVLGSRDSNAQRAAHLTLDAALRNIATPREPVRDDAHLHRVFPGLDADERAAADADETPAASRAPVSPVPPAGAGGTSAPPADPPIDADADVMLDPPPALDQSQHRQWDRADDTLHEIRTLLEESSRPSLAPLSVAAALRDASHRSRALAGLLEGLAGGIEARERRRTTAA
jgi:hypothetical protein